jgi:hypothetical protein
MHERPDPSKKGRGGEFIQCKTYWKYCMPSGLALAPGRADLSEVLYLERSARPNRAD